MFDLVDVGDAALVQRLQDAERSIAVAQAEQLAVIAELDTRSPEWLTSPDPIGGSVDPLELTVAEVGAALRISRTSATRRVEMALAVCSRLPGTLAALGRGEISMTKLRVIVEATEELTADHAREVEDRVLPRAPGQTPAGLGASVARAVIAADPAAAEHRRRKAVRERTVRFFGGVDGMATLWLRGPAGQTMAAFEKLCELGKTARTPGDDRTVDACRADTLIDLILDSPEVLHQAASPDPAVVPDTPAAAPDHGRADGESVPRRPGRRTRRRAADVQVTVAWTTLAELDDLPGHLAGYGPITAEYARELAADATWRRLLTDPATGTVLDVGTIRYRPPAALAALVRARDGTCRWFGCRRPAERCDLDHTVAHPQGPTAKHNLEALCRPHHRIKTHSAWRVVQNDAGVLAWTSPAGLRIMTQPWTADSDPDPPDPVVNDGEPPWDPLAVAPDWLDALPTDAEIAAQLARYSAAAADYPSEDNAAGPG